MARASTVWKQEDPHDCVFYKLSDYPHPFIHPPRYFLTLTPDLKLSSTYVLYLVVIVCAGNYKPLSTYETLLHALFIHSLIYHQLLISSDRIPSE